MWSSILLSYHIKQDQLADADSARRLEEQRTAQQREELEKMQVGRETGAGRSKGRAFAETRFRLW